MNHEILFRGKCVDNGEWVEGRLLADDVIIPITEGLKIEGNGGSCIYFGCDLAAYEVIPKTVGQYTELCDNNGVKIFEGDIVKEFCPDCPIEEYRYDIGHIFYYKDMARFIRTSKRFPDCYADMSIDKTNSKCEVIGNVFDNPDLLEGAIK